MNTAATVVLLLILAKWAVQLWLVRLNQRHVLQHADRVPEAFESIIDSATYGKTVQYTLAKSRLHQFEITWSGIILLLVLFSGILPRGYEWFVERLGSS